MTQKSANRPKLEDIYDKQLSGYWRKSPFVLRFTEWKNYPPPVLVVKERLDLDDNRDDASRRGRLSDRGCLWGEAQRRCLPLIRHIIEPVCDSSGVPLELQRFITQEGLKLRINLPLDEEAGAKLALLFRLQERLNDADRVELIGRRIMRFSREEAAYWLSHTTSFGADANRWAISGMRLMLGGQAKDEGVQRMLDKLRA
jgi:hypothetical protein